MSAVHPRTESTPAESARLLAREFEGFAIGVVIPAYRVSKQIERVIAGIPAYVDKIIVVEDASRDGTLE